MAYAAIAEPSRRAEVWFDGPAQQRRWTVLLRLILVIPQFIVLAILGLALEIVVIIGWFAALFMGRLPEWAHTFIGGVVRWQTRVNAYYYLLTDQYPPYEFVDEAYPVRPILPPSGRLNRLAVFFRLVLVLPASLLYVFVMYGLLIPLLFVTWLIVLFSGRMPNALHGAYAAFIRFGLRLTAYVFLLTPEYPWGLLGDRMPEGAPGYQPATSPPAWSVGSAPPYPPPAPFERTGISTAGAPERDVQTSEGAAGVAAPVPPAAAPAWLPPPPPPSAVGATSPPAAPGGAPPPPLERGGDRARLVLPRASRGWMIFAIVWGVVLLAGYAGGLVSFSFHVTTTTSQHDAIVDDFNAPNGPKATVQAAVAASNRCTTVECLRPSHLAAASSLQFFAAEIRGMSLPSNAQGPAQAVESDADQLASAFTKLANSPNAQAYRSTVDSSGLNTLLRSLPNDTNALLTALTQSVF